MICFFTLPQIASREPLEKNTDHTSFQTSVRPSVNPYVHSMYVRMSSLGLAKWPSGLVGWQLGLTGHQVKLADPQARLAGSQTWVASPLIPEKSMSHKES